VKVATSKNLIANGAFDAGKHEPESWQWVLLAGRSFWRFDESVKYSGRRSVVIMQDIGRHHGEFRQNVAAVGARRYRVSARLRGDVEGSGDASGASVQLTAMGAGQAVDTMTRRRFFTGHMDWGLWSCEYVTPPETDELVVSFDMRNSAGAAWFDDIRLFEGLGDCFLARRRLDAEQRP